MASLITKTSLSIIASAHNRNSVKTEYYKQVHCTQASSAARIQGDAHTATCTHSICYLSGNGSKSLLSWAREMGWDAVEITQGVPAFTVSDCVAYVRPSRVLTSVITGENFGLCLGHLELLNAVLRNTYDAKELVWTSAWGFGYCTVIIYIERISLFIS